MAAEYDQLDDLWYSWLVATIHEFIAAHLPSPSRRRLAAIDFGCGTGFQSFLLSQAGYSVTGIDIAADLLSVARRKASEFGNSDTPSLFKSSLKERWLTRHHERLGTRLNEIRQGVPIQAPEFKHRNLLDYSPSAKV